MYSTSAYFFSKMVIEIPLSSIFPALYVGVAYYICGFNSGVDHFFKAVCMGMLVSLSAVIWGMLFGTLIKSEEKAVMLGPMLFVPFFLFAGLFSNIGNIFVVLRVFEYISPLRYAFEFLIRNEFEGNENAKGINPADDDLNFFFKQWETVVILIGYIIVLIFLSIFLLKWKSKTLQS